MANMADIEQFSSSLVHQFKLKRIFLFGSHAWGTPSSDSDVDLLVVLPFEGKPWCMARAIRGEDTDWQQCVILPTSLGISVALAHAVAG